VPPSPTGRVAVIDGADNNLNTNPASGTGTSSPSNNPNSDSDTTLDGTNANNANTALTGTNTNTDPNNTNPDLAGNSTAEKGTQSSDTSGLSMPTKIGIGVGAGAGTVLLVVVLILVLWKRRMGRGPPSVMGDSERGGGSPTPQEKAKMDWESEHDVAFDFGGFFRERAQAQGSGGDGKTGKLVVVNGGADEGDRLPAFETPLQQQHQRQRSLAELDGGDLGGYRGVIGVGR
jgi:hypothetical protein